MLLAVDVGNTNITVGLIDNEKIKSVFRLSSGIVKTIDQYASDLYEIINYKGIKKESIEGAIISSVVPSITLKLALAIENCLDVTPLIVDSDMNIGIEFDIDDKRSIGADLIAGCAGAVNFLPGPLIVIDLGTATTLMVIDSDRKVQGGCIIPGIRIAMESLYRNAALLPEVSLDKPRGVVGKNTVDCIKSGAIYGNIAMLEGLCDMIESSLGYNCNIVVTGGLTPLLSPYFQKEVHIRPNLLLEGLSYIYRLTQKNTLPQR